MALPPSIRPHLLSYEVQSDEPYYFWNSKTWVGPFTQRQLMDLLAIRMVHEKTLIMQKDKTQAFLLGAYLQQSQQEDISGKALIQQIKQNHMIPLSQEYQDFSAEPLDPRVLKFTGLEKPSPEEWSKIKKQFRFLKKKNHRIRLRKQKKTPEILQTNIPSKNINIFWQYLFAFVTGVFFLVLFLYLLEYNGLKIFE